LKHIPKAVPILKKYRASYYTVVCRFLSLHHISILFTRIPAFNPPASKAASIAALGPDEETGKVTIQGHDAIATIKFPSLEALKAFMESPENKEQLAPDGPRYTSEVKQRVSIGTEWLGIEGG
jgi:hypothetical protein